MTQREPLTDEDQDLVEVIIACTNGQMGRAAALEVIGELDLAGFEIVRKIAAFGENAPQKQED